MPRTIAIGDVHGCDTALRWLLTVIDPEPGETVIFLGDLVNRGPGTKQVLDEVLRLQQRCSVVVIQGNHEEMMRRGLAGELWGMWMQFGGEEALASYGGRASDVPDSHRDLIDGAVDYWETLHEIFIHASLQPEYSLAEQHAVCLRWTHVAGSEPWFDPPRRVICGHTPQKSGLPLVWPGWVCLDTDCQRGGWLTALDVEADWVYQANEQGRVRDFVLSGMP